MAWPKALPALGIVALALSACSGSIFGDDSIRASGEIIEDARDLDPFTSLDVDGPVHVVVVTDGTHRVEMQMDRELERRAMFDNSDGRFSLDFPDDMSVEGPIVAELVVHVARLDDLEVEAAASVSFDELSGEVVVVELTGAARAAGGTISAARFELDVSGASTLEAELSVTTRTTADLGGASSVTLAGRTAELVLGASGASDVAALGLDAGTVRLELTGSSSVQVFSSDAVDGELSGASDLHVRGDADIDVDTSGASTVARS